MISKVTRKNHASISNIIYTIFLLTKIAKYTKLLKFDDAKIHFFFTLSTFFNIKQQKHPPSGGLADAFVLTKQIANLLFV